MREPPRAIRAWYEPTISAKNGVPFDPDHDRTRRPLREIDALPAILPLSGEATQNDNARIAIAYDSDLAYALSIVSAWAYADGQTLSNKLHHAGLPDNTVQEFAVTNPGMLLHASAALVRSASGRVGVLAFRGTEPDSLIDLLTDGSVCTKPYGRDQLHVHTGFLESVEVLWDDIREALGNAIAGADLRDDARPRAPLTHLFVTGHSLGGAMAVIAAMKLCETPAMRAVMRAVYTYGQPAVGSELFARHCALEFGDLYFRVVHAQDVIPHLPPRECGDFYHFGRKSHWDATQQSFAMTGAARKEQCEQVGIALAFTSALVSLLARRMPRVLRWVANHTPYALDDHMPAMYVDCCHAKLPDLTKSVAPTTTPLRAVHDAHAAE